MSYALTISQSNITGKIHYVTLILLIILNALDSFPKKTGKLVWGLKRLPRAENKRWEQMAWEASQDVRSGLCHATHSQDNPERRWDGVKTSFEFTHVWSGTIKILLNFYSNPQRCQKWGQLLDGCDRLPVALAWWKGRGAPIGWKKIHLFFSANLPAFPTDRHSLNPKILPEPAAGTLGWVTWLRLRSQKSSLHFVRENSINDLQPSEIEKITSLQTKWQDPPPNRFSFLALIIYLKQNSKSTFTECISQ